jgi:antitoxin ParD1/3/4
MDVLLTPDLERYVQGQVDSGQYPTASEVIREGLRLLKERDQQLQELRREIQIGIDQAARGEVSRFDDSTLRLARECFVDS